MKFIEYAIYQFGKNVQHKQEIDLLFKLGSAITFLSMIMIILSGFFGAVVLITAGFPMMGLGDFKYLFAGLALIIWPFLFLKLGIWLTVSYGERAIMEGYQEAKEVMED